MAIVSDLDGVLWLARSPIPGAADAVARLRRHGHRVLFVTNNSASRVDEVEAKLAAMGVAAEGEVVTSSVATASLIAPGERVFMVGGLGVAEALEGRGAVLVGPASPDVVVVGRDTGFTFDLLRDAAGAVRRGARFVATNDDSTFPTPEGLEPGNGALVAAVATASGVAPVVAGKPYEPMAAVVRARLDGDGDVIMVGDRLDTDGRFASRLGARFALVLTGVTASADATLDPAPDLVVADLSALADHLGA